MPSRIQASLFLLVVLAGCTAVPHGEAPADMTVMPDQTSPVPALAEVTPLPVQEITPPAQFFAPVPSSATGNLDPMQDGWVSLAQWCEANGYGTLRRMAAEAMPTYMFSSTRGTMAVRVGSQSAYWNGLEYRLGFAPLLVNGQPYVHLLDARKNFSPLADEPVLAKKNHVIVIDPGHGGGDVGASNVYNGHFEKEYTLDLARRLQALLVARGWTVWLTRSNDVALPLPLRVALAESRQADLFISLHFNSAFPDRQQAGLETYCLTPAGMPSSLTRGYVDDASLVYPNNRWDTENLQLAEELHRALLTVNGHADRGVRRARFLGVLQGQNRPAVLVEGGYLSNPQEARQIADPAHRQKLAEALAQAITEDSGPKRTNLASQSPVVAPMTNVDGKIN